MAAFGELVVRRDLVLLISQSDQTTVNGSAFVKVSFTIYTAGM